MSLESGANQAKYHKYQTIRVRRFDVAALAIGALAAGFAFGALVFGDFGSDAPMPEHDRDEMVSQYPDALPLDLTLPPCEFEDSVNCYWDAQSRGDGQGASFIDIDGVTYYLLADGE